MAQVPLNILLIPPSLYNPLTTSIGPEYLGGPVAACCTYDRINPIRNSLLVKRIIIYYFKRFKTKCSTCNMHFILSPGAMIEVVNTPEIAPATASCLKFNSSSGCVCCIFFPNPNPAKLSANMGATPIIGAPMPSIQIPERR